MSLLKRRSRSETRKFEYNNEQKGSSSPQSTNSLREITLTRLRNTRKQQSQTHLNNLAYTNLDHQLSPFSNTMGRRKTSAELISEAKTLLDDVAATEQHHRHGGGGANHQAASVGSLRLISTRRPITPRESGRALYGKVALAGRPPSAFSLRYLQNHEVGTAGSSGNHRGAPMSPSLAPIKNKESYHEMNTNSKLEHLQTTTTRQNHKSHCRSNSLDSQFEFYESNEDGGGGQSGGGGFDGGTDGSGSVVVNGVNNIMGVQTKAVPRKLPALNIKGIALAASGSNHANNDVSRNDGARAKTAKTETNKSINLLTSRKLLQRNYDLLAQSSTEKLIEMLKEHSGLKDCTEETINHVNTILVEVYARVRQNEKHFKRGFILGGLYGLVECSSPKILLAVARVVLALRVTGSNLTGACKLIFKVARNEQNDYLFHDNDLLELLIDGLGRASPLDDPEACIYGYGSIRFLTSSSGQERAEASAIKDFNKNWAECIDLPRKPATAPAPDTGSGGGSSGISGKSKAAFMQLRQERFHKLSKQNTLVERLAQHGAVELMVLHLQILNEAGATQKLKGPPLHSLYQLSAALRALADVRQTSYSIEQDIEDVELQQHRTSAGNIQLELACPHLVRAAEVSMGELEVQANIVRTLSVLSEDYDCCHVLVNFTARIGMLLGPCCEIFSSSTEKLLSLFSRLGYILGNIMAKYDNARVQFYHNDVAMEYLLNVLQLYSKESITLHNASGDTVLDVLVKMIRVVANMSVNSEVGFGLGNTRDLGAILLTLLNTTNRMKSMNMKSDLQELLHATLGALHNLCFYQDKNSTPAQVIESKGSLQSILPDLAVELSVALRTYCEQATQVEITRVLGNLTRNEKARKFFCKAGGLPIIVQHLSSKTCDDYDLKACVIGVLVNLLGDWENRAPFINLKGTEMLAELMKSALQQADWFLATIIGQAFWNLLIATPPKMTINDEAYPEHTMDDVCDLLVDYLDEERLFDDHGETDAIWENFAVVATDLLERIQSNYERHNEDDDNGEGDRNDGTRSLEASDNDENDNDEDDVYIEEM